MELNNVKNITINGNLIKNIDTSYNPYSKQKKESLITTEAVESAVKVNLKDALKEMTLADFEEIPILRQYIRQIINE